MRAFCIWAMPHPSNTPNKVSPTANHLSRRCCFRSRWISSARPRWMPYNRLLATSRACSDAENRPPPVVCLTSSDAGPSPITCCKVCPNRVSTFEQGISVVLSAPSQIAHIPNLHLYTLEMTTPATRPGLCGTARNCRLGIASLETPPPARRLRTGTPCPSPRQGRAAVCS